MARKSIGRQMRRSVRQRAGGRCEYCQHSENCLLILGRTQTGRATVETLHLNRPEAINLRFALKAIGEHPPTGEG